MAGRQLRRSVGAITGVPKADITQARKRKTVATVDLEGDKTLRLS
jgi:hypothetical protein